MTQYAINPLRLLNIIDQALNKDGSTGSNRVGLYCSRRGNEGAKDHGCRELLRGCTTNRKDYQNFLLMNEVRFLQMSQIQGRLFSASPSNFQHQGISAYITQEEEMKEPKIMDIVSYFEDVLQVEELSRSPYNFQHHGTALKI